MNRSIVASTALAASILLGARLHAQISAQAAAQQPQRLTTFGDYLPCTLSPEDAVAYHNELVHNLQMAAAEKVVKASPLSPQQQTSLLETFRAATQITGFLSAVNDAVSANKLTSPQGQDLKAQLTTALTASTTVPAPPGDVFCSESLLEWKETSDIFGRRIADQYIAIQVTIRNLSSANQFILHDVQFALDTVRFYGTRDRRLARGVAEKGQALDKRNFGVRIADAIASVAGAASVLSASTGFKDAVNIFQGAVVPGIKTIFPDYTIQQLGRLDDLGYSHGANSLAIAKDGALAFTTFIPSKEFATGYGVAYKSLTGKEIKLMQEHLEVVVAGVHVQEVINTEPQLDSLNCPATLDFLDQNGNYQCEIKGRNLERISAIKLTNATDSTDTVSASGNVTLKGGDTATAAVVFKNKDIVALKASEYAVATVKADNMTAASSLKYHKATDATPTISSFTCPDAQDFSDVNKTYVCSFKGVGIIQITKVTVENVADTADKADGDVTFKGGDSANGLVTFKNPDLAKLKSHAYKVFVATANGRVDSKQTFTKK